jgi:hypothetical protein
MFSVTILRAPWFAISLFFDNFLKVLNVFNNNGQNSISMGDLTGNKISKHYLEVCGILPMPPIEYFYKNWSRCQWYIDDFSYILLQWAI